MKRSSRLSAALHVLVHLAQAPEVRRTSEEMAGWWHTNPVVVRRTLGQLREAKLVVSVTGPGGGWTLARDPAEISLAQIYSALGEPVTGPVFEGDSPSCLVAAAIDSLLADTKREIERRLMQRLEDISLADLVSNAGIASHHADKEFRDDV